MSDLGRGVVYREDGPLGPLCPICPSDKPHRVVVNESRLGGYRCEGCDWTFDGDHGEAHHPRNRRRRDIWAEETRAHTRPEPEGLSPAATQALAAARAALPTPEGGQKEAPAS